MRPIHTLFLIVAIALSGCKGPLSQTQSPNIIFILADDLGYGDVGFNGGQKINTPALDQMAKDGVVFTNHYSGSAVCGPYREIFMTGLHTGHSPVRENPRWTASGNPVDLSADDITVAEELKRAGYTTGIIGKWGLGEKLEDGVPNRQGFDYFYGFNKHKTAHHYYPETVWENDSLIKLEGNKSKTKEGSYSHYLFMDKAHEFIERNKEKPFFLYLAFTIPHFELTIPEHEKKDYADKDWPLREMKAGHYRHDVNGHVTYASMVSRMDKDIDQLRQKLKALDLEDNTLLIFTSDNGHEYDRVGAKEFLNSNGPFRGKKRDLYEGGIRMPFVAVWPGNIEPGSQSEHVSAFWDFLPTACDIANVSPKAEELDGISYLPALLGSDAQEAHPYLYWEFNEGRGPIQAIRKGKWKMVYLHRKGKAELYDLETDPGEKTDLATQYVDQLNEMMGILKNARSEHPEFPLEVKKWK